MMMMILTGFDIDDDYTLMQWSLSEAAVLCGVLWFIETCSESKELYLFD